MKMFILVRSDLSKNVQLVQACHAVSEYMRWEMIQPQYAEWDGTMVALKVKDEAMLEEYWHKLGASCFREPDLNNEMTAIVAVGDFDLDLPLV